MVKSERVIYMDADVVSHFLTGGEIYVLPKIFNYPLKVFDKVYAELEAHKSRKQEVANLLTYKILELVKFPDENNQIRKEYYRIKKELFKGDGESATLAVVKYSKDIIASSNLRDIHQYCKNNAIDYLTTMDFLCKALKDGLFDVYRCNAFIEKVLNAGSKLPVRKIEDYNCKEVLRWR